MHLVGFIISIYHDTRSNDSQRRETINWLLSPRAMYTPVVQLTLSHWQYHPICSQVKSRSVQYNNTVTFKEVNCWLTQQQAALIAVSNSSETKGSKISSVRRPETINWYRSLCAWKNLIGKDPAMMTEVFILCLQRKCFHCWESYLGAVG